MLHLRVHSCSYVHVSISFILFPEHVWVKINVLTVVSDFKKDLFFSNCSAVRKMSALPQKVTGTCPKLSVMLIFFFRVVFAAFPHHEKKTSKENPRKPRNFLQKFYLSEWMHNANCICKEVWTKLEACFQYLHIQLTNEQRMRWFLQICLLALYKTGNWWWNLTVTVKQEWQLCGF